MKYLIILVSTLLFTSCNPDSYKGYDNYTLYTEHVLNTLKQPVILIAKDKSMGCYGIVVKDANDSVVIFGNMSSLADRIGASMSIGDTIR